MSKDLELLPVTVPPPAYEVAVTESYPVPTEDFYAPVESYSDGAFLAPLEEPIPPEPMFYPAVPEVPPVPEWVPLDIEDYPLLNSREWRKIYWKHNNGNQSLPYSDSIERYIINQFKRFRVQVPRQDLLIWCWETASYYITVLDPSCLFYGQTDVYSTQDHKYFQYIITNGFGVFCEVDSTEVNVYRFNPRYAERFAEIYNNPGLDYCFEGLRSHLENEYHYGLSNQRQVMKFDRQYGEMLFDIIHLGVWSAALWMVSPQNSQWRYDSHLIFSLVYNHGECVEYRGANFPPSEYRRLSRAAHSCSRCNSRTFCVRLYNVNYKPGNMHLSESDRQNPSILLTGVNPGTYMLCRRCAVDEISTLSKCRHRFCPETGCIHHPNPNYIKNHQMS